MNEQGKEQISSLSSGLFLMLAVLAFFPYLEANDYVLPFKKLTTVQYSEFICWVFFGLWAYGVLRAFSYIISGVCCYVVYFVQRAWYLHKLRKPERVYTGDPL